MITAYNNWSLVVLLLLPLAIVDDGKSSSVGEREETRHNEKGVSPAVMSLLLLFVLCNISLHPLTGEGIEREREKGKEKEQVLLQES